MKKVQGSSSFSTPCTGVSVQPLLSYTILLPTLLKVTRLHFVEIILSRIVEIVVHVLGVSKSC